MANRLKFWRNDRNSCKIDAWSSHSHTVSLLLLLLLLLLLVFVLRPCGSFNGTSCKCQIRKVLWDVTCGFVLNTRTVECPDPFKVAWDQAPQSRKKEKKSALAKTNRRAKWAETSLGRGRGGSAHRYFSYFTPLSPFSPTTEPGP